MKVDYKQARDFLERISSQDKVAIYTHIDLDGLASGILFENFCKKKKCKDVEVFFLNYGISRIADCNPSKFNKFLIADLAPSAVAVDLPLLNHGETLYTDHHQVDPAYPVKASVLELRTTSEGYIPSSRTVYELTEKENQRKLWLATLGVFGDAGYNYPENNEFLEKSYKKLGITKDQMMEFTKKFGDVLVFFSPELNKAHEKLNSLKRLDEVGKLEQFFRPVEEEMKRLIKDYESNREISDEKAFYMFDTKYPAIKSPFINRISSTNSLKVFIFANLKKEGILSLSARNQAKLYDVTKVITDCVSGLREATSGGHSFAAGGSVSLEDLDEFKLRFKQYDLEKARIKNGK